MATEKITFSGVRLLSFKRNAKQGGVARFRSSVTSGMCEKMGWPEPDERLAESQPEGDLAAKLVELVPVEKPLQKWMIELDAQRVSGFAIIRREMEKKKGKGFRHELQFDVTFGDVTGCAKLEQFMLNAGAAKCGLLVGYAPKAKQDELPGTRVDMTPEDSNLPLDPEALAAANETPVGPQPVPTHADRIKARKDEEKRKREMRESTEVVQ